MTGCDDSGGIYIALGANLGDRAANLDAALRALARSGEITVLRVSSLYETLPQGGPAGQPHFLNAAAELRTSLPPRALLERLLEVECELGRTRASGERNGPRSLDLDLLIYADVVMNEPGLTLPHPRMWERDFVLRPLAEICDLPALHRRFAIPPDRAAIGSPAQC